MTEDEVLNLLQNYLVKLDNDAAKINPNWTSLSEIVRGNGQMLTPVRPYAEIQLISSKDTGEVSDDDYEDATIDGRQAAILSRTRAWKWLFRLKMFSDNRTDTLKLFTVALTSQFSAPELSPLNVRKIGKIKTAIRLRGDQREEHSCIKIALTGLTTEKMLVDVVEEGRVIVTEATSGINNQANYKRN